MRGNLSSGHQVTIKATAGTGSDVGTFYSPPNKPEGCNGWSPRELLRSVALLLSHLFSHWIKIKLKRVAKMEKSKDSGSIHDSAKGNHIVGIRKNESII